MRYWLILFIITLSLNSFGNSKQLVPDKIGNKKIPSIDGNLKDPVWGFNGSGFEKSRSCATDFTQIAPQKGFRSSLPVEVKVVYTSTHIYFGIFCYDRTPGKISATITKRDNNLDSDDSIGIYLDTFCDRRSAYLFSVNPLGTQLDGRVTDNGRTKDTTLDMKWASAAGRVENGWTAEISIPLASIKYQPGKNRSWGLGICRNIPRNFEKCTWTWPVESKTKVSQFGTMNSLNLKASKKKLQIIPHTVTRFEKNKKHDFSAGLDVRYAFSQAVSTNLTINPDFATIEADQETINLTRFEQGLTEKRNFFLEGAENYKQRIKLFYSRRIKDIYGAAKLYGKTGKYEYSVMSVQSRSDDDSGYNGANYSVFRVKRDIFKSSSIGFLLSNKLHNQKNYGSAGLDLVHFFTDKFHLTAQLAMSYGDYSKENIAFFVRPSYDTSDFHLHLRYTQLGSKFADNANHTGFVVDDDRHELDSALEKIFWINKYGIDKIEYSSNYNIYWSKKSVLRSWAVFQYVRLVLSNKFSLRTIYTRDYKLYEKKFNNNSVEFLLGYNTREWESVSLKYKSGKSFDMDYKIYGAQLNYKIFKNLSFQYELNRLTMVPNFNSNTWIHVFRVTNYFNRDLFFKLFYQTNSAIDKKSIQALLVYRFQPPFGTIQLAYQRGTSARGQSSKQEDTLFIKFSYVL